MNTNSEVLIDLIFNKLKKYNSKEIFLEKKVLKKFIFSLFKENQIRWNIIKTDNIKCNCRNDYV